MKISYCMEMQDTFNKINSFVRNEIASGDSLVIRPVGSGFKVNRFKIYQSAPYWNVADRDDTVLAQMFSRKFAVLAAALLSKQQTADITQLKMLDSQMAVASEDQFHYEIMLQNCSDRNKEVVYGARLSRAKQLLEAVRAQIRAMEKSLQLQ